ncbi:glyoxalase superfamily protein [Methylobacterium sp. NMS12]|uniref:glyoxalase superfamily protein n=1 Tax=Methylobacterium sp. NMS12 TaxID=3079766 RepID=UPI003F8834C1
MPTVVEAKSMARAVESALRAKNVTITHGECLDIVARQFGLKDWNVLSAQAKRSEAAARRRITSLKGWALLAEHPDAYDHGADADPTVRGGDAALIRHDPVLGPRRYPDPVRAFACYMQSVSAVPFRGRRVAIGAKLRCQDVTHGATLWVRVDAMPGHTFAFDNLKDAPDGWLFGNTSWVERRVVLDVCAEAISLHFGFFLKGRGALWAADFRVEEAAAAALTAPPFPPRSREAAWSTPTNLTFSEVIGSSPV